MAGLAALALCGCEPVPSPEALASAKLVQLTDADKAEIARVVSASLKDPGSTQFKWPALIDIRRVEGTYNYCGMWNSKNGFGGYVGFGPFYVQMIRQPNGAVTKVFLRDMGDGSDTDSTMMTCTGYGYAGLLAAL